MTARKSTESGARKRPSSPDPIGQLPFVGTSRRKGAPPRCFWCVKPSDDPMQDERRGAEYGRAAIAAMRADNFPPLLGIIAHAQRRRGHDHIAIGFWQAIAEQLLNTGAN